MRWPQKTRRRRKESEGTFPAIRIRPPSGWLTRKEGRPACDDNVDDNGYGFHVAPPFLVRLSVRGVNEESHSVTLSGWRLLVLSLGVVVINWQGEIFNQWETLEVT